MAKYLKKAKRRLEARIKAYEAAKNTRDQNTRTSHYNKPGSLKVPR